VINLFRNGDFPAAAAAIRDVVQRKCAFKGIAFPTLDRPGAVHGPVSQEAWLAPHARRVCPERLDPAAPIFSDAWFAGSNSIVSHMIQRCVHTRTVLGGTATDELEFMCARNPDM
jgi:hypothetical protein